ncbi:MAG: TauD/TfdA family dioxygenase, partial [Proteobacteria bacterium]|nr:TauD/TfdA family dioxygenase [Pseudomonadota bacterium]
MSENQEPVTGPAVWMGRDLEQTDGWITPLTPLDVSELAGALAAVENRNMPVQEITASDFPLKNLGTRLK